MEIELIFFVNDDSPSYCNGQQKPGAFLGSVPIKPRSNSSGV